MITLTPKQQVLAYKARELHILYEVRQAEAKELGLIGVGVISHAQTEYEAFVAAVLEYADSLKEEV